MEDLEIYNLSDAFLISLDFGFGMGLFAKDTIGKQLVDHRDFYRGNIAEGFADIIIKKTKLLLL